MPQVSLSMSSVITKRIISCKYFQFVGLDSRMSCKFHIARPVFRRVVGRGHRSANLEVKCGTENFFGIESDDGVVHVREKTQPCVVNSSDSNIVSPSKKELLLRTTVGHLRFDSDNQPNIHGQFETNIAESEFFYGSDAKTEKIQNLRSRKGRDFSIVEKFYTTSPNRKELEDSAQCTNKGALEESKDFVKSDGNVHQKLDLGFIDRAYFYDETSAVGGSSGDLHSEKLCVDSNILQNNFQEKEMRESNLEFHQNNSTEKIDGPSNFIDSIYFEHLHDARDSSSPGHSHQAESKPVASIKSQTNDYAGVSSELKAKENLSREPNFIDSVYFGTFAENTLTSQDNVDLGVCSISSRNPDDRDAQSEDRKDTRMGSSSFLEFNQGIKENLAPPVEQNHMENVSKSEAVFSQDAVKDKKVIKELENELYENEMEVYDREVSTNSDNLHTAYKYVLQLRNMEGMPAEDFDSKGFRILKNQIPDLSQLTRSDLADLLKESVLFSDDDIVILNKPYNLIIHESKTTKLPTLSSVLDDLAQKLDTSTANPQLHTVHRLDKETTGCFLLARNELAAQKLKRLFAQHRLEKNYLVVTIRVPDPCEGVIDIPITEGKIENRHRMVLQPDIPKEVKYKVHAKNGKRAITHYKVVSTSENAALLEVRPETGVKHQIRVHLGFGLNCPILGDHKYSHLTKLAPQRLSGDILRKLEVQQSKVRYMPIHIHSRTITIPEYLQGRDLFVSAPLPKHMKDTLKRLKFKKI